MDELHSNIIIQKGTGGNVFLLMLYILQGIIISANQCNNKIFITTT